MAITSITSFTSFDGIPHTGAARRRITFFDAVARVVRQSYAAVATGVYARQFSTLRGGFLDGTMYRQLVEEIDACDTTAEVDALVMRVLRTFGRDLSLPNVFDRLGRRRLELEARTGAHSTLAWPGSRLIEPNG